MPSRLAGIIARLLGQGRRHETHAVKAQLRVLRATRDDVLRSLVVLPSTSYRAVQLGAVLVAIDAALAPNQAASVRQAGSDAREAFELGQTQADATIGAVAPMRGGVLSTQLLQAVVDVTEDQIRDVWGELGSGLKAAVRRVALGASDPETAMVSVQRLIRSPKTFGSAAVRAEMIVRTEVNRTYNVAADARYREMDVEFDGGLRKAWIATVDPRTRKAHVEAGRRYGPGATDPGPIPMKQMFVVGGDRLRYPLDPLAPARAVIACRCRLIALPPTVRAAEWAALIEESDVTQEARAE